MDYACERGAKRNFEPWRDQSAKEETEEERLDRLEAEEEEKNAMVELETKTLDAKREMQIADALDEIRTRNARIERGEGLVDVSVPRDTRDEEREREEREIEEAARRAFETEEGEKVKRLVDIEEEEQNSVDGKNASRVTSTSAFAETKADPVVPTFKKVVKKKKDFSAALGIKKKPGLV